MYARIYELRKPQDKKLRQLRRGTRVSEAPGEATRTNVLASVRTWHTRVWVLSVLSAASNPVPLPTSSFGRRRDKLALSNVSVTEMVGGEATATTVSSPMKHNRSKAKRQLNAVNLSNATNSMSPDDLRSRIFIGNLNTSLVTKRHLHMIFSNYGEVKAISMHKGKSSSHTTCTGTMRRSMRAISIVNCSSYPMSPFVAPVATIDTSFLCVVRSSHERDTFICTPKHLVDARNYHAHATHRITHRIGLLAGYAFVQYGCEMDALNAVIAQDQQILSGQSIGNVARVVDFVRANNSHNMCCVSLSNTPTPRQT